MLKRIITAGATGCAFAALSLLYRETRIDAEFRGAPFAFLQTGMTLAFESKFALDFKALALDVFFLSLPVWVVLQLSKRRKQAKRATGTQ